MPHGFDLVTDLTGGLSAALVCGYITQRLGLSPLVGYLLAGILVGPFTPGFVADPGLAEQMAEIGVVLLMFGVGLQFHIEELLAVRRVAMPGALVQSAVATVLGALVAPRLRVGLVGGARLWRGPVGGEHGRPDPRAVRQSQPAHTGRSHRRRLARRRGPVHGDSCWSLLPPLFGERRPRAVSASPLVVDGAQGCRPGRVHVPGRRARDSLAARSHREDALARAVHADACWRSRSGSRSGRPRSSACRWRSARFSPGWSSAGPSYSLRAASDALPMRDAFAVLFFVSVGMLLDPRYLLEAPLLDARRRWRSCSSANRSPHFWSCAPSAIRSRLRSPSRSRSRRSVNSRSSSPSWPAISACCRPRA